MPEFEFKRFAEEEPKITFEETIITDDDKGVNVYASERIIIIFEGKYFLGRYRKKISNFDNRVEEQYVDIETPDESNDKIIGENYVVPLRGTMWSYLPIAQEQ